MIPQRLDMCTALGTGQHLILKGFKKAVVKAWPVKSGYWRLQERAFL